MDSLKPVKVLVTAVDCGSLTKAGKLLGYTQSNVTQIIKAFENELGFPLLAKTRRGVEPTGEAKQLLPAMRALLSQEEKLRQEIDGIRGIRRGSIRIGTFVSTSSTWLPKLLSYFQKNYPGVTFAILESGQDEMERGILDGTLDIALMSRPGNAAIDFIPLIDDPMLVVFSEKHDLSRYDRVPVGELASHPIIMTDRTYDRDVGRIFSAAGITPDVKYCFKNDFAVLATVRYGLGIAVLPQMTLDRFPGDYDSRKLDPEAFRTLGIGIRSLKAAGPLARFIIDCLKENVR